MSAFDRKRRRRNRVIVHATGQGHTYSPEQWQQQQRRQAALQMLHDISSTHVHKQRELHT